MLSACIYPRQFTSERLSTDFAQYVVRPHQRLDHHSCEDCGDLAVRHRQASSYRLPASRSSAEMVAPNLLYPACGVSRAPSPGTDQVHFPHCGLYGSHASVSFRGIVQERF